MRLFINPGHGDQDPGAVGNGLQEHEVNRRVAEALRRKLAPLCTLEVYWSGKLSSIAVEANKFKADYFVSIHANAANASSANGIETYCFQRGGRGEQLAAHVQRELVRALGRYDRGVKVKGFAVLRDTLAPAILTEIGFISNKTESDLMKTDKWYEDASEALAIGISNQLGLGYRPGTVSASENAAAGMYRVQIGAFTERENAENMLLRAKSAGFDAIIKTD